MQRSASIASTIRKSTYWKGGESHNIFVFPVKMFTKNNYFGIEPSPLSAIVMNPCDNDTCGNATLTTLPFWEPGKST